MKKIIILLCLVLCCCSKKNIESISYNTNSDGLWDYLNNSVNELTFDESISKNDFNISFWYKTNSNKVGTNIFKMDNIELNTLGYDGLNYSGLTLTDLSQWIVADGINTIDTNRYNYIVINFNNANTEIYLNGKQVAKGKFKRNKKYNKIKIENNDNTYISDFTINKNILSNNQILQNYNQKLPSVLLDTIQIKESDDMINNYWLDNYLIDGYDVKWSVDKQDLIDYRGVILKKPDKDEVITLNATLTINDITSSKDFIVNLRKEDDERLLKRDILTLTNYFDIIVHSNHKLPNILENGSNVIWESDNDNVKIVDNKIIKQSDNDKEQFNLTAKVFKNNFSETKTYKINVIDEVYAYVMAYFNGELNEETAYLAYSEDGLNWKKLDTKITTNLGSKRVRDPFISRDKENNFVMVATEGFDNPNIYVFKSNDLINFDNGNLIQIAYYDKSLRLTGERAWAPEFIYNLENDKYYVYFSDNGFKDEYNNVKGSIYCVTSDNFDEFSYPFKYLDTGYSIIDGTIIKIDGKNVMFYKDERKAAQTIFYSKSNELNSFSKVYDEQFINENKYMEGPFIFENKQDGYYIYMDNYPHHKFYVGHFNKLDSFKDITWYDENMYTLPEDDVRHGSVLPITKKEADKILENNK